MKYPPIQIIKEKVELIFKRFPLEGIFCILGTAAAVILIKSEYYDSQFSSYLQRISYSALIGLVLALCNTLYCERKNIQSRKKTAYQLGVFLFSILFFLLLNPYSRPADHPRFFLICLSLHLAVSFSGFLVPDQINGFWQFNKTIFLRFLTGALYSIVLFLGIAAAMGAMDYLFHISFYSRDYGILWVLISGLFNTFFFLAGIPRDIISLNAESTYPKGLKIFTQYVLIPLASIYLLILLSYELKILLSWDLPKGQVSNLILGYAVFGILSLLLVYPIKNQVENRWIKQFSKSFYVLMLPLLVLLFLALWKRVSNYGFTEYRYFLMILSIWLLFITLYFLTSKKQSIKIIPISLSILALISGYGPQSAFSVAERSQKNILFQLFNKNHLTINGKLLSANNSSMSKKDKSNAYDKADYLITQYGIESVQPFLIMDVKKVKDSIKLTYPLKKGHGSVEKYQQRLDEVKWCTNYLGIYRNNDLDTFGTPSELVYTFKAESDSLINISGYDIFFENNGNLGETFKKSGEGITIKKYIDQNGKGYLYINNEFITINLSGIIDSLIEKTPVLIKKGKKSNDHNWFDMSQEELTFKNSSKNYSLKILIENINYAVDEKKKFKKLLYFNGYYLLKKLNK